MSTSTGTLFVARDIGAAWGRQQIEELAASLNSRLHQPVTVCWPENEETPLLERIQSLVELEIGRLVIVPFGIQPVPDRGAIPRTILSAKRKWPFLEIHVAAPLTWLEWSAWLGMISLETVNEHHVSLLDAALLLVGQSHPDPMMNANLACLAHLIYESTPLTHVAHAFLDTVRPGVPEVIRAIAREGLRKIFVLPWLLSEDEASRQLVTELEHAEKDYEVIVQIVRPRLAHPALVNLLVSNHYAAQPYADDQVSAARFPNSNVTEEKLELEELESRINALLPPQYQGRYEDVSRQSMGTAGLKFDSDGKVAWDEIWTSFCDLALAGGPPHRGTLLEAVTSAEVLKDPGQYQEVVAEIERGIQLITALPLVKSQTPGWVGVRCESEEMAVWLMRAIIVENIMVRREKDVLYLPAGPRFTVKREIKNVITALAKTVHYWKAHLNARRQARGDIA